MPGPIMKTVVFPDIEGDFDYLLRLAEKYGVSYDQSNSRFVVPEGVRVVFMGDIGDGKPSNSASKYGDLDVFELINNTYAVYPQRVVKMLGNRDLNKLRLLEELFDDDGSVELAKVVITLTKEKELITASKHAKDQKFIGAVDRYKADSTLAWTDAPDAWLGQALSEQFGKKTKLTVAMSQQDLLARYDQIIKAVEAVQNKQTAEMLGVAVLKWMLAKTMAAGPAPTLQAPGSFQSMKTVLERRHEEQQRLTVMGDAEDAEDAEGSDQESFDIPVGIPAVNDMDVMRQFGALMAKGGAIRRYLETGMMVHECEQDDVNLVVTHGGIGNDSDKCGPEDQTGSDVTREIIKDWGALVGHMFTGNTTERQKAYVTLQAVSLPPGVHGGHSVVQQHIIAAVSVINLETWAHQLFFKEHVMHISAHSPYPIPTFRRYIDTNGRISLGQSVLTDTCNYRGDEAVAGVVMDGQLIEISGKADQKMGGFLYRFVLDAHTPDLLVGLPLDPKFYPSQMSEAVRTALAKLELPPVISAAPHLSAQPWSISGVNLANTEHATAEDPVYTLTRTGVGFKPEFFNIKQSQLLQFVKEAIPNEYARVVKSAQHANRQRAEANHAAASVVPAVPAAASTLPKPRVPAPPPASPANTAPNASFLGIATSVKASGSTSSTPVPGSKGAD